MNAPLLHALSAGLLATILCAWAVAAPAPPHLEERVPFKLESNEFGRIARVHFSADGKTLLHVYDGHSLWHWDVATRKHTASHELPHGGFLRMFGDPGGKTTVCQNGKSIALWDIDARKHICTLEEDEASDWVIVSPDGKKLSVHVRPSAPRPLGETRVAELRIWDVEKRKRLRSIKTNMLRPVGTIGSVKKPLMVDTNPNVGKIRPLEPRPERVPFNVVNAFTGETEVACQWEIKDGRMPYCFAVNAAETIVATAGDNCCVHLWDRSSGKRIARFKPPPAACHGLSFSPDGNILIYLYGRTIVDGFLLYAVPSGKILAEEKQHLSGFNFSPDGGLLVAGDRREIKVWSIPPEWRKKDK